MADDTTDVTSEQLDDEPKNVLFAMIKQLRYGMDLHRITFPTFVLEPRSMLERITDFMAHQDIILQLPQIADPMDRFITVVRYFMSGWHIRPKGVKKPYNPVIGEFFRCKWIVDGTESFYFSEQVSHHPPISAYYFANPDKGIFIHGSLAPKSRFLGNSAASIMGGKSYITLNAFPNEQYVVTMPNMYAVGLFLGTMTYELADNCSIFCEKNDLIADIEFKFKPMFGGSYNNIAGKIKRDGEVIYNLSGKWSDLMYLEHKKKNCKEELFDVTKHKMLPKEVLPEEQQNEYESRRLWSKVSQALIKRNLDLATDEKTKIEDLQRKLRSEREHRDEEWTPNFFKLKNDEDWEFVYHKPGITAAELQRAIFEDVNRVAAELAQNLTMNNSSDSLSRQTSSAGDGF